MYNWDDEEDWDDENDFDDNEDDDDEDDGEGDGWGKDSKDGYGKDVDDKDDDEEDEEDEKDEEEDDDVEESEEGEEEDGDKKKKKKDDEDEDNKKEKKQDKEEVKGKVSARKLIATAKALDFPAMLTHYHCPKCKQRSIFPDKYVPTGIRLTGFIVKACVGAVNVKESTQVARFVCLNSKCKDYFPRSGVKFAINPLNPEQLEEKKNWFHIQR